MRFNISYILWRQPWQYVEVGRMQLENSWKHNIKSPNTAPSRLFAAAGINYRFLRTLAENDLINYEKIGKRHTKVSITDKGRTFLAHARANVKINGV